MSEGNIKLFLKIMYHKKRQSAINKKPARWIARILPSGHFSCGRIPPTKEPYYYNPNAIDFQVKVRITRIYHGDGYECTVKAETYYQCRKTGRVITVPCPNGLKESLHDAKYLSSVATPEVGLTDMKLHGIQDSAIGAREDNGGSALGLSSVPSSRKAVRQGLKGITRTGRMVVREGCYIMKHDFGNKNLGFYTLTLPHHGESLRVIARNWHKVVHRYFEELGRAYQRKGCYLQYVSVTEIQEKRYQETGEVAPHLHYVANSKHNNEWVLSYEEIRGIFQRVCERIVNTDYSFASCEHCVTVRKDAGRYLSKYFSKGGKILESIASDNPDLVPKRWHKVSRSVIRSISADTSVLYDEEVWNFLLHTKEYGKENPNQVVCEALYVKVSEDYEMLAGYWGKVKGKYDL